MERMEGLARPSIANRFFNEYRVASYLLVLYALGHTAGAVVATPEFGGEGDSVAAMMKSIHLHAEGGADCTWYGFYRGFGIFVTLLFVVSAAITWFIGGMTRQERVLVAPVTWSLFVTYGLSVGVCLAYFFPTPTVFSAAVTIALGIACARARRDRREIVAALPA